MADDDHVLSIGTKKDGSPFKALVVDDSEFMVKNLKRMLNSFDAEVVDTAEDGTEAVAAVEERGDEIDFITLDITMPEMNGLEALEEILDIEPDMQVLMVSAMGQEDTIKEAVMKGAKHFIVKPFEREDVYDKLEQVLTED